MELALESHLAAWEEFLKNFSFPRLETENPRECMRVVPGNAFYPTSSSFLRAFIFPPLFTEKNISLNS